MSTDRCLHKQSGYFRVTESIASLDQPARHRRVHVGVTDSANAVVNDATLGHAAAAKCRPRRNGALAQILNDPDGWQSATCISASLDCHRAQSPLLFPS